ncbi:MAG: hypothetical protein OHK0022_13260 [Roseiflexaceae bacterium]
MRINELNGIIESITPQPQTDGSIFDIVVILADSQRIIVETTQPSIEYLQLTTQSPVVVTILPFGMRVSNTSYKPQFISEGSQMLISNYTDPYGNQWKLRAEGDQDALQSLLEIGTFVSWIEPISQEEFQMYQRIARRRRLKPSLDHQESSISNLTVSTELLQRIVPHPSRQIIFLKDVTNSTHNLQLPAKDAYIDVIYETNGKIITVSNRQYNLSMSGSGGKKSIAVAPAEVDRNITLSVTGEHGAAYYLRGDVITPISGP